MKTVFHKIIFLVSVFSALLLFHSCQKTLRSDEGPAADHALTIQFNPVVDNDSLEYGKIYHNIFGEDYSIRNFKFYVCQVDLINTDSGKSYSLNKDQYFLVNFGEPGSTKIQLNAVSFRYNRIAFVIGVDSIRNVSGAQTGSLDPANGMFWTWNSGYIMAKLEGNSPVSSEPNQVFEYHIGGFSGADKVVRKVNLSFPLNASVLFEAGKRTQMTITANANAWFSGPNPISIAGTPVCTTPGSLAKSISANYATMFNVINILSE